MAETFRERDPDQAWPPPPWVHELAPEGRPARFARNLAREDLDRSAIEAAHAEERGRPPYPRGR